MKQPIEMARRWLAEAEHGLGVARLLYDNGLWSKVCFEAEQSAQLALKAFLYGRGRRVILMHSVQKLALECSGEDVSFAKFVAYGRTLDKYYLSSRYPDALAPPAIPFESFTEQEARQALEQAAEIVNSSQARIAAGPP